MRAIAAAIAGLLLGLGGSAQADTLIDHLNGITLDGHGGVSHFTGIVIGNDGRITAVLHRGDKRVPTDFAVDGRGRVAIAGLVVGYMQVMASALALIAPPGTDPKSLPPPRPEDRDLALATLQPLLLARGITAVTDMGTTIEDWQAYRRAGDSGRLSIRIIAYASDVANMVLIGGPGPTPWLYEDRLRLVGLSIDAGGSKRSALDLIQLKNRMSRAALDHFQVAVRLEPVTLAAISDALPPERLAEVSKAISELGETYQGDRRWRVETVPAHLPLPDPLAHLPETARLQTLDTYSAAAAQSGFAESHFGRIAVGLRADFVMLDADPLDETAPAPQVLETWVGGRKVFAKAEAAPGPVVEGR